MLLYCDASSLVRILFTVEFYGSSVRCSTSRVAAQTQCHMVLYCRAAGVRQHICATAQAKFYSILFCVILWMVTMYQSPALPSCHRWPLSKALTHTVPGALHHG